MQTRTFVSTAFRLAGLVAAGVIVAMTMSGFGAAAKDEDDKSLAAFMRKKLDSSSKILEGITTEDADLITQGANSLLEMSKAEKWNVIADEDYREFNRYFRSAVRKLGEAAEAKNFDNATLQWFDAVKGCVECHKYVRDNRPKAK